MGFYRQEYWSGLSFPSPGDLPKSGIEPRVSRIASRCFTIWATRENLRYPYGKAFQNYSNKPVLSCSLCCILLLPLKPQSKKKKNKKNPTRSRSGSGFPLTPILCPLTKTQCFPCPCAMQWPCSGTCAYHQLSYKSCSRFLLWLHQLYHMYPTFIFLGHCRLEGEGQGEEMGRKEEECPTHLSECWRHKLYTFRRNLPVRESNGQRLRNQHSHQDQSVWPEWCPSVLGGRSVS